MATDIVTAIAAEYPNLASMKPARYMRIAHTSVENPGPPRVITHTMSKTFNEKTSCRSTTVARIPRISGRIRYLTRWISETPSTVAASCRSWGIPSMAASRYNIARPVYCHVQTSMMAGKAIEGSPSQT
jgi:hypothetical protein